MSTASPLRTLIADTALRLGPGAPTLCTPWSVQDLVAHLVIRESRPDVLPGIGLGATPLGRHTSAVQDRLAATTSFEGLVSRFRGGPPAWWPTRLDSLDSLVNTAEFAIHHEDMVRAQAGAEPTTHHSSTQGALWGTLLKAGPVLYRSAPVGVVAVSEGHGRASLRGPRAGTGSVVLRGAPLELLLHAFGRTGATQAVAEGSPEDVAALAAHTRAV